MSLKTEHFMRLVCMYIQVLFHIYSQKQPYTVSGSLLLLRILHTYCMDHGQGNMFVGYSVISYLLLITGYRLE